MTINFPRTSFQILRAQQITESVEHRTLIVGQMLAAGTATTGVLLTDLTSSEADIASKFGARSAVAGMLREFKKINKSSAVDVLPLDDNAGGTQATATVGFSGTATEAGSIFVEIGSGFDYRFKVDVLSGDSAAAVAGKLNTLIAAATTAPYTAVLATADVDLTAANAGTLANNWSLFVEGAVAGISTSLSSWTGGATDPVLTNVFAPTAGRRYQTVVWPSSFTDTVVESFLNDRFNVANDLLQGVAIITAVDSFANVQAKAAALNSQSIVLIGSKARALTDITGSAHREFPDIISARVAAIRALRLTDDAALSQFLTTPAPLDQFGGRALASLPYANSVLPNTAVLRGSDDWTPLEQETFKDNGVAVIGPNRNFSSMLFGEFVTTNTTDEAGNPDVSFKFLNTVDSISAVRDSFFLNMRRRYAQTRLTTGDLLVGRDLANQAAIEAFCEEIWQTLVEDAIVQGGGAALRDFKANGRVVGLDVPNGRVTIDLAPILINGLRVISGTVQVNFGT